MLAREVHRPAAVGQGGGCLLCTLWMQQTWRCWRLRARAGAQLLMQQLALVARGGQWGAVGAMLAMALPLAWEARRAVGG